MNSNSPAPMPHQVAAVEWIHRVRRGLLADEPGLGKSRTAIESFDGGRVLVVAPALIINSGTWTNEINRWAKHPEGFHLASYTMLNARRKTDPNRPSTTRPIQAPRPEFGGHWDAVVFDEAHYIKGRKTVWVPVARQIAGNADSALLMTGTPVTHWGTDLFVPLQVIHPDESHPGERFGSYWRWATNWFQPKFSPHSKYALGDLIGCTPQCRTLPLGHECEHYRRFTHDNLGEQFLRRTRDGVLPDLPPLTYTEVLTPMSSSQKRAYQELKKHWLTEVEGHETVVWSDGSRIDAMDLCTVSEWLLGDRVKPPTGGKFDQLKSDLSSRTTPTVVFAHHRAVVEASARVAEGIGARVGVVVGGQSSEANGRAVRDFLEGRTDVLVGSLSVMSEGLTLTRADMLIFMEKTHRPAINEQAMRRVHRIGQSRPVTVLDYVTPKSLDENKRKSLDKKIGHSDRILSAATVKEWV